MFKINIECLCSLDIDVKDNSMDYGGRLELVTKKLVEKCKHIIQQNLDNMFDMWLQFDADMEFGYSYIDIVKEHSLTELTAESKNSLFFAGKNVVFFIQSITKDKQIPINKLLKGVEAFITFQMDDFHNWCEDVSLEVSQDEDNPSN